MHSCVSDAIDRYDGLFDRTSVYLRKELPRRPRKRRGVGSIGTDRVDSRTRGARCGRGVARSVVANRAKAYARVREREKETRHRVPHLSARAWGVRPSVLPLLPPACFFRFFSLDCSRLRPRAMSSSWGWGKGRKGGGDGVRARSTRSHASRALKWGRARRRVT